MHSPMGRLLRRLLPCCCSPEEDEKPLRFSHANGISSSDAWRPDASAERSATDVAAEAARAQEWCLEHLEDAEMAEPRESRKGKHRKNKRHSSSPQQDLELTAVVGSSEAWAPPSAQQEREIEAAIAEHVPRMTATATRRLVDAARRSPGQPPLLAAAQVVADRAPTEASALLATGTVEWLRDGLNRPDTLASAAATHRLCFALRSLLESAPAVTAPQLRGIVVQGESSSGRPGAKRSHGNLPLSGVLCAAISKHRRFAPLVEDACFCIAAVGRYGGRSSGAAFLAAGAVDVVLEAMAASKSVAEVQAAGASALGSLLSPDQHAAGSDEPSGEDSAPVATRQIAERALGAGALLSLAHVIQHNPERTSCVDAALDGLLGLIGAVAPRFDAMWPRVELSRERTHASAANGDARGESRSHAPLLSLEPTAGERLAAKHAAKMSVPLLCAALLLKADQASPRHVDRQRDRMSTLRRASTLIQLLAACVRLGLSSPATSKLLSLCEQAATSLTSSSTATDVVRHERAAARAACEVWALLPPSVETHAATLQAMLSAATALAAAAGVRLRDPIRDRDEVEFGGEAPSVSDLADRDHAAWCAALLTLGPARQASATGGRPLEALMQAALRSGFTSRHSLPPALKAVTACLDALPPARAVEAAEALCGQHGLLVTIRNGLGPTTLLGAADADAGDGGETDAIVRAVAASLRALALLLRVGGSCRSKAMSLPVLRRPGVLPELLSMRDDIRGSWSAQAAGCALLRSLVMAGGSSGTSKKGVSTQQAHVEVAAAGVDMLVAALSTHGDRSVDVAREACEAVGTLSTSRALLHLLVSREQLVSILTRTLEVHGQADRQLARAACHALRLLCSPPGGTGGAPAGDGALDAARAASEFRKAGGEQVVRDVLSAHGSALRSVAEQLLLHASDAGGGGAGGAQSSSSQAATQEAKTRRLVARASYFRDNCAAHM